MILLIPSPIGSFPNSLSEDKVGLSSGLFPCHRPHHLPKLRRLSSSDPPADDQNTQCKEGHWGS